MEQQTEIPGRLEVIWKNVQAAREVYEYIAGKEKNTDLRTALDALKKHLSQSIQLPKGWSRPYVEDDVIWLHPEKKWKRKASNSAAMAISVRLPFPVAGDDQDACVELYVPFSEKLRQLLTDFLRSLVPRDKGWQHIDDFEPDTILPEYPIFKYIEYGSYGGATGFDTTRFFDAIANAVKELLQLESEIDRLFDEAKAAAANPRLRSLTPARKHR